MGIVRHNAAFIIYNFADRLGGEKTSISNSSLIESVISCEKSLLRLETQKTKSSPTGSFTATLGANRNWITTIAVGSWCVILMSRDIITEEEKFTKANKKSFKMLGRIESVRSASVTDETGAISVEYTVTGVDWSSILELPLYVDPIVRAKDELPIATAMRLIYDKYLELAKDVGGIKSISNVKTLLNMFGNSTTSLKQGQNAITKQDISILMNEAIASFVPVELKDYMGFSSNALTNEIDVVGGVLQSYDTYDNFTSAPDGVGIISPQNILGSHSLWGLILGNSNPIANEVFPEIRWSSLTQSEDPSSYTPNLTLYTRIRPFCTNTSDKIFADNINIGDGARPPAKYREFAAKLISRFDNVRRIKIPRTDIVSIQAGNNWRDKINFIETRFVGPNAPPVISSLIKLNGQIYDSTSISRDGFRPMFAETNYWPVADYSKPGMNEADMVCGYKYLLKEWHFDTHLMLNGNISMVGQSDYIGVGDNIVFDLDFVAPNSIINNESYKDSSVKHYMLAHVESVSNSCVCIDGSISFFTGISFIRGVVCDENGKVNSTFGGDVTLDQDGTLLTKEQDYIYKNFGSNSSDNVGINSKSLDNSTKKSYKREIS